MELGDGGKGISFPSYWLALRWAAYLEGVRTGEQKAPYVIRALYLRSDDRLGDDGLPELGFGSSAEAYAMCKRIGKLK